MVDCRYSWRQITTVRQSIGEPLLNYLNHYNDLLERYPNHGLSMREVLYNFFDGMLPLWYKRVQDAARVQRWEDMYVMKIWDLIHDVATSKRLTFGQLVRMPLEFEFEDKERDEVVLREVKKNRDKLIDELKVLKQRNKEEQEASGSVLPAETEQLRPADLGNSSMSAERNASMSAVIPEEGNKIPSTNIPLPFSLQVVETEGEEAESLDSQVGTRVSNQVMIIKDVAEHFTPYEEELTARATKRIPENMSKKFMRYENFGRELDWNRTGKILPYKRCQRKRYVVIRKFDYIYPWELGL